MSTADRFPDLASVRAERMRLHAERDQYAAGLQETVGQLKDKEFRKALLMDTISDVIGAPTLLGAIAKGASASRGWLPFVAPLLAGRKGILGSRLFWTVLGFALPAVVSKKGEFDIGSIWNGIQTAWSRIREGFASGENAPEEEQDEFEAEVNE